MNIGSIDLYALREKKTVKDGPFDMNIAGGDVLFLCVFGALFVILIFVYE